MRPARPRVRPSHSRRGSLKAGFFGGGGFHALHDARPHAQAWHSSRRRNGTLQKRAFGYSRRGCGNRLAIRRCERLRRCERTSRSEENTSELQSLMRKSFAVFCLKQKKNKYTLPHHIYTLNRHSHIIKNTNQYKP